jgi:NTE family protein
MTSNGMTASGMKAELRRIPTAPPSDAAAFLEQCELLAHLPTDVRSSVAAQLSWYRIDGQDALIVEGDEPDAVFLLYTGTLRALSRSADGRWAAIREHRRGDIVGEASILAGAPRSATIVAVRDSIVAALPSADFLTLLEAHASLGLALSHVLSTRLVVRTPPPRNYRFVAVVPTDEAARSGSVWDPLIREIVTGSDAMLLTPSQLDATGIARYEQRDRVHLVNCQSLEGEALDRVLRQADRIIAVMHTAVPTGPNPGTASAIQAVVTGPAGPDCVACMIQTQHTALPTGTTALRNAVGAVVHHHVRESQLEDARVIGRTLSGTDLGFVFGGGGARGAAHIGVLRACESLGLNADRIGGTSMGAIAGSVHAAGYDWHAMLDTLKRFERSGAMREISVPTVAVLGTRKLDGILRSVFGDASIDDLWRPFFCTSVDLTRGELAVHDDGPAATWVRASGAVPGVFPPVAGPDGSLHIDGGLLNNLPADVMRTQTRGLVVLVDVAAPTASLSVDPHQVPPLGWRDVRARIKKQPTFPSVLSTLQRGTLLTSAQQRAAAIASADLLIEPALTEFGLFDFGAIDEIVERGYRAAMDTLPTWAQQHGLL